MEYQALQQPPRIALPVVLFVVGVLSVIIGLLCEVLIWRTERLRGKLRMQGISGPPPSFLLGNLRDMKRLSSGNKPLCTEEEEEEEEEVDGRVKDGEDSSVITHNCSSKLFPYFDRWRKEYGPVFTFSMGSIRVLYVYDLNIVKEMSMCTSVGLGKPSYQSREMGPLLGDGILTSNGTLWAHQRRIIAPELYPDKVKSMINLMVESSTMVVKSWIDRIERGGGEADIRIDVDMRSFSGDLISRACFGSNYSKGKEIFVKLRALKEALSNKMLAPGIPGLRHIPTESNRAIWRLEKEVRLLILKAVKEREGVMKNSEKDLLQMILQGAKGSGLDRDAMDCFIVDNCKNIYMAGYETTAVTATWTLMLLASHPEWQAKVREELNRVCAGRLPDSNMLRKMKMLTMVIYESLRLYPPVAIISREALQDMKFGDMVVPRGVTVWMPLATLHTDPDIWGPDAALFHPDRFSDGVSASCLLPHSYMPFGVGPRVCLGQNLAMAELKVLLSIIVSNFAFSLSPGYRHSPTLRLVVEPEHGVNLIVKKLGP